MTPERITNAILTVAMTEPERIADAILAVANEVHDVARNLGRIADALEATPNNQPKRDERPHSRACGYRYHPHGPECSNDCPTCKP